MERDCWPVLSAGVGPSAAPEASFAHAQDVPVRARKVSRLCVESRRVGTRNTAECTSMAQLWRCRRSTSVTQQQPSMRSLLSQPPIGRIGSVRWLRCPRRPLDRGRWWRWMSRHAEHLHRAGLQHCAAEWQRGRLAVDACRGDCRLFTTRHRTYWLKKKCKEALFLSAWIHVGIRLFGLIWGS